MIQSSLRNLLVAFGCVSVVLIEVYKTLTHGLCHRFPCHLHRTIEMNLCLQCPGRSRPCRPLGLQAPPSPSTHEMNCPPTSAGRGIGPETHPCRPSAAMHLRVSRGSIVLCLYRCCHMSSSRRTRPSHSSRFQPSTMNTSLCLWRCHDPYLVPSWEACCFCHVLGARSCAPQSSSRGKYVCMISNCHQANNRIGFPTCHQNCYPSTYLFLSSAVLSVIYIYKH